MTELLLIVLRQIQVFSSPNSNILQAYRRPIVRQGVRQDLNATKPMLCFGEGRKHARVRWNGSVKWCTPHSSFYCRISILCFRSFVSFVFNGLNPMSLKNVLGNEKLEDLVHRDKPLLSFLCCSTFMKSLKIEKDYQEIAVSLPA